VGCSALGTQEGSPQGWGHNLAPVGMSRRVPWAMAPVQSRWRGARGLASGCCESGSGCGEQRKLLLPMATKWWVEKEKKPTGKFPSAVHGRDHRARSLAPLTIPSIPWTLPNHALTRFSPALPVETRPCSDAPCSHVAPSPPLLSESLRLNLGVFFSPCSQDFKFSCLTY